VDVDDPIAVGDNDIRLFNDRDPTDHPHAIGDLPVADSGEANAEELVRSDDARLSDSRTPSDGSVTLDKAATDTAVVYICDSTTRPDNPKRGQLIYELDSTLLMKNDADPATPNWQPIGSGAASITFQEEGSTIAQRSTVNVVGEGATVIDDAVNSKTQINIAGLKVQASGSTVGTHATLNIIGATVANDTGNQRTNVTIAGGVDASTTVKGLTKLSVAPSSSTNPIAVGDNDPRIASVWTPRWVSQTGAGSVFGAYGDGDPERLMTLSQSGVSLHPGNLGNAVARIVSFTLPKTLSLTSVRMWTFTNNSDTYLAIYRHSDGVRMWNSGALSDASDNWANYTSGLPVTLAANTRYWIALATLAGGTTSRWLTLPPLRSPGGSLQYGADNSFFAAGRAGMAVQAQIPVSSASYPATMPMIAAASYVNQGGPIAFLVGTPS
jgi:hypothetical protein